MDKLTKKEYNIILEACSYYDDFATTNLNSDVAGLDNKKSKLLNNAIYKITKNLRS